MNSIDFDLFYQQYLTDNEYVVWKGRPESGNLFISQDFITLIFGLFFLGFSLFWEFTVITMNAPFFFPIFGLLFVGVGFYLVIGRFFHQASLRKRSFYVITNKKLLIKQGNTIKVYDAHTLPPMDIYLHHNGNGTIRFTEYSYYRNGRRHHHTFSLDNIPDVAKAQNALHAMER